ncbi:hypothetical protein JCM19000A_42610 [Silvimonas sp. JCM 19000]
MAGPGSMGNKWFAGSAADAAEWGKKSFLFDQESVFTLRIKLNNIGPARSADGDLLNQINLRSYIDALSGSVLR